MRLNPADVDARLELAVICLESRRTREATEHLTAVLRVDPAHRGARQLLAKIGAPSRP